VSADFVRKGEVLAEATSTQRQEVRGETLEKQPKTRHMTMISLGGIIGAGLFVGSGAVTKAVGRTLRAVVAETGTGEAEDVREVGK